MKKWTIFFIIHALDKELIHHATILIKILEGINWNLEDINILYLKNTYKDPLEHWRRRKIEAKLFEISITDTGEVYTSNELKNYGQINIGRTVNLDGIFADVFEKYKSERTMLI